MHKFVTTPKISYDIDFFLQIISLKFKLNLNAFQNRTLVFQPLRFQVNHPSAAPTNKKIECTQYVITEHFRIQFLAGNKCVVCPLQFWTALKFNPRSLLYYQNRSLRIRSLISELESTPNFFPLFLKPIIRIRLS